MVAMISQTASNTGLFGYNINLGGLGGRDAEAKEDARLLNASAHLLMTVPGSGIDGAGELNQLRDWETALEGSQIIRRTYNRKEGDWKLYMSPKEQVAIWAGQGLFSMLHDAPANEPSLAGTDVNHNKAFVEREREMIYRCADAGIAYLSGAFSVGTPHEHLIDMGIYDPILIALHDTRVEGGGISAHLYGLANGEAGERVGYESLLNPQQARADMVDTVWQLGDYWLLRRTDRFIKRADTIGVSRPRVFAAEAKIDLIPDANHILNQLRSRFGLPEYNFDMRGIQSIFLYLAAMFPELDYEQAVAHITAYFGRNIFSVDYIKAVCLFSLNQYWDRPQGHNYFNDMLRMYRKVYLPEINRILGGKKIMFPDASDERWEAGVISATDSHGTNVRSEPRVNGSANVVGFINQPTNGYRLDGVVEDDLNGASLTWQIIRYRDTGNREITGYISTQYHSFVPDEDDTPIVLPPVQPPADDDTQPVLLPDGVTEDVIEAIIVQWLRQNTILDKPKLMAYLGEFMTENGTELFTKWMIDNTEEITLHISAHLTDTPELFDMVFARFLRQAALHLEQRHQPASQEATH